MGRIYIQFFFPMGVPQAPPLALFELYLPYRTARKWLSILSLTAKQEREDREKAGEL